MFKSMTGYSKAEASEGGITASVEIKSLNGKNLDLNMRSPRSLNHREVEMREIIRKVINRGSVSLFINLDFDEEASPFSVDENIAAGLHQTLTDLRKKLKIREAVKLEHLMLYSNNFLNREQNDNETLQWKLVKNALRDALNNLDTMRKQEGSNISRDIQKRINEIHKTVSTVEKLGIDKIPAEREKFRHKIAQLFENDEIDEQRLQMEMVIMADKLDFSEECVRMYSHLKLFNEAIKSKDSVGKRLNFILQEMNREVNTIGSKANDSLITKNVINLKEEIERIREQIQNIE